MIELLGRDAAIAARFFAHNDNTMALSFLQGHIGRGWVDDRENPRCAQILIGDLCLLVGDATAPDAAALCGNIPEDHASSCMILVPENDNWSALITGQYGDRARRITRFAIKKENGIFDRECLQSIVESLPNGYQLRPIDAEIFRESRRHEFSTDWCSQFTSAKDYLLRGIGYCITKDDELVSGASSYVICDNGIEIQIDTKDAYKRQGLAAVCAARLILACLDRHLYPSWDAASMASVALAEKLGYHFSHAYEAFDIEIVR